MANFIALKVARDQRRAGTSAARAWPPDRPWPLPVDRDTRRERPRRRHARHGCRTFGISPSTTGIGSGWTSSARRSPRSRAGHPPDRGGRQRRHRLDRRVDPLGGDRGICAEEELWFHVDAAYGGPAMLADDLRPLFAGIERADSIAFDPHKWLYTPHSGGCVLVRDMELIRECFDAYAAYTVKDKDAPARDRPRPIRPALQPRLLGAEGLGVAAGARADAYARRISHDAALARYLGARVEERDDSSCAPRSDCRSRASGTCRRGSPRRGAERARSTCRRSTSAS